MKQRNTKFTKVELKKIVKTNFSLSLIDKEKITSSEDINVVCNTCGRIFTTNRKKLANLKHCPICSLNQRKPKLTFDEFVEKAYKIHKTHYTYFKDFYFGVSKKSLIRCNWCRNIFWQDLRKHLNGSGCEYCNIKKRTDKLRLSEEDAVNLICNNLKDKFTFVGLETPYKNNKNTNATVKCNICGYTYTAQVNVLAHRDICCKQCCKNFNIAEERVKMYLSNFVNDIRGETRFKDLKYKSSLRFDIFLPEYMTAIEIQGYHHDKPYKYSKKQTDQNTKFEEQKIKDQIKRDWCKLHDVKLIEIPYSKVRRKSGIKKLNLDLVKKEYTLQDIEDKYDKFILTEELKTILK